VAFYERYGFDVLEAEAGHLGDRPEPTAMLLELGAIPKSKAVLNDNYTWTSTTTTFPVSGGVSRGGGARMR